MDKVTYEIGARVDKFCEVCQEERGHIVASVRKSGHISRVSCSKCGHRSSVKAGAGTIPAQTSGKGAAPYDRTRTYRTGQHMMHPMYGQGEVTAVIEPQKIDVLFADRIRRLIHSQQAASA